jgi:hypothetical protein
MDTNETEQRALRVAAARQGLDVRTLKRFLAGGDVRGLAGERCRAAVRLIADGRITEPATRNDDGGQGDVH